MTEVKQVPPVSRLVNTDASNQVTSRRTHRFWDCSMLDGEPQTELSEREAGLLGLSECKVCLKRAEGGPALQAMVEILVQDTVHNKDDENERDYNARAIIDGLRQRGFYISQRQPKADS